MATVRYIAQRKDIERVVHSININKRDRVKPKKKPKRFKRYVGSTAKVVAKRATKETYKKTKKKLKEIETTEGESISSFIGSTEKISKTLNESRKLGIKSYRKIQKVKLKKNKHTFKEKSKISNAVKPVNIKSRPHIHKQKIKVKLRKDSYLQVGNSSGQLKKTSKSTIPKSKIDKRILNSRKLKIQKVKLEQNRYNVSKQNIYIKKNKTFDNEISSCKNVKEIVERKKRKKYEDSKKVSNLDTFSLNSSIAKDKSMVSNTPNKQGKFNEKSKTSKKIATQVNNKEKTKYVVNKNNYTKQLKEQSRTLNKTKKLRKNNVNKISTKAVKNISKILAKVTSGTVKVAGAVLSNPYVLIAIAIIIAIVVLISVFIPIVSLFENKPNTDTTTLKYLVEQIAVFDDEANEYLTQISDEGCDRVVYRGERFIHSAPKDFIIYLMLVDDNVITKDSRSTLKAIHDKSYKINKEVVKEVDDETGEVTRILNITLTIYTFDEMLDILGFTQEQKDRAYDIMKLPFDKIFAELGINEAGQGLSDEEIEAIAGQLPGTTVNRENLRSVAFTLVDYTVYEWGGKANGSVEKPTGLDCSGFVAWVYDRAGITKSLQAGGTAHQWSVSSPISYSELKVGDLGFKDDPRLLGNGVNHVGIYIGNGKWIECYSGHGVGVTSGKSFRYYRKVKGFND